MLLPVSYKHSFICMFCYATKTKAATGGFLFSDFREQAEHRGRKRSHAEIMALFRGDPPALTRVVGFNAKMVKYDVMHTLHLGVLAWVCGNVMVELLESDFWGRFRGALALKCNLQLRKAWAQFKRWCSKNAIDQSRPPFTLAQLGIENSGIRRCWPVLKAKASNAGKVFLWLAELLKTVKDDSHHHALRMLVMKGWADVLALLSSCDEIFFSPAEAERYHRSNRMALLAYGQLSRQSFEDKVPRWQLRPKHHVLDEIGDYVRDCRRNPRSQWLFKHEDYMGLVVAMGQSVRPQKASRRVLERFLLRYAFPSVGE